MQSKYDFCVRENFLGQTTIILKEISQTTEFIRMILQVLGMYNFILKASQDIWQDNHICAMLDAPNGLVCMTIDTQKNIAFTASKNQSDILFMESVLCKLYLFKKEIPEIPLFAAS